MKRSLVYGGLVGVALLGSYCFGRRDRAVTEQERQWADSAQVALKMGKTYREGLAAGHRDLLKAQAEAQQARAATSRAIAVQDSLEGEIGALRGDTAGMTTPEQWVGYWKGLYEKRTQQQMQTAAALTSMTQERDLALEQVGSLTAGLGAAKSRVSELEGLLERGIELQKCRILGLVDCPSRTTSFVGGAVLGIVLRSVT